MEQIVVGDTPQDIEGIAGIHTLDDLVYRVQRLFFENSKDEFFKKAHALAATYFEKNKDQYSAFQQHYKQTDTSEFPSEVRLFLEAITR